MSEKKKDEILHDHTHDGVDGRECYSLSQYPHTIVSTDDSKALKSKVFDADEQLFSFTFNKVGTYPYICSIHPKMTGKVIVQ